MTSNSGSMKKKRKSTVLPRSTVDYLKAWMMSPEHVAHPYPTEKEKLKIMADTGIELKQLTNWFVNNRKRFWKPRVEARLQQQLQAQKAATMANTSPSGIVQMNASVYASQQLETPIAFSPPATVMPSPNPHRVDFRFSNEVHQPQPSFQIITNHSTFPRPCSDDDSQENCQSQVVSMGSASYSSDSDCNNSVSNVSSDGQHELGEHMLILDGEEAARQKPPTRGRFPLRKRHIILGSAIARTLGNIDVQEEEPREVMSQSIIKPSSSGTMKRSRSKSDLLCYSSPRNIICRPRSLTINNPHTDTNESCPKRRFVEGWQSACRNARHGYDTSLPTMEEAALLFGFAQKD